MRAFTYIDVAIQTFILCAAVMLAVLTLVEGSVEAIAMIAMYGACFLGPWQMLSSVITCVARWMFLKWRLIHLVTAVVYLTILSLLVSYTNRDIFNGMAEGIIGVLGFAVPAILAVFYYYITVKSFRIIRNGSGARPAGA